MLGGGELGGAERQAIGLAEQLRDDHGALLEVWGLVGTEGAATALARAKGLVWRSLALPWYRTRVGWVPGLARFALRGRRSRADLFLPFTILPNVVCGLGWRAAGARASIWNQRDEGTQRERAFLERRAVASTTRFVANSSGSAGFLAGSLRIDPGRITIIPNGVAPATRAPGARLVWRERFGIPPDRVVGVMLANLHGNKDHETLLRAWARLPTPRPLLLLAGRDDGRGAELGTLAVGLGLEGDARMIGQIDDVAGLLAACDLGLLSSRSEGSPNALLECMAAGLPIAATDVPGIRDAVGPDGVRFLAPAGDDAALAGILASLVVDAALRASVGAANVRRVALSFAPRVMTDRMAMLIGEALGERTGRKQ